MNLVPIWASPSPRDFVHHQDLIAVDSFLALLELVTLIISAGHPDLVTLVLTWASPGPSEYAPPLCLIWTW